MSLDEELYEKPNEIPKNPDLFEEIKKPDIPKEDKPPEYFTVPPYEIPKNPRLFEEIKKHPYELVPVPREHTILPTALTPTTFSGDYGRIPSEETKE